MCGSWWLSPRHPPVRIFLPRPRPRTRSRSREGQAGREHPHTVCRRLAPLDGCGSVLDEGLGGSATRTCGLRLRRRSGSCHAGSRLLRRRRFAPGTHHGLLLVRLPDSEQWRIGDYVTAWLSSPDAAAWSRCSWSPRPPRSGSRARLQSGADRMNADGHQAVRCFLYQGYQRKGTEGLTSTG